MANRMRDMGWAVAGAAVALVVGSPAWAAAPKAPLNLRIDDQARPLSVEGAPRFGWLPQDDDANEIQTAYEIEVRDARRSGVFRISSATAPADSGPSTTRQGMITFWSCEAAHSK